MIGCDLDTGVLVRCDVEAGFLMIGCNLDTDVLVSCDVEAGFL
jgi:hypothetical protein